VSLLKWIRNAELGANQKSEGGLKGCKILLLLRVQTHIRKLK
jgi:hypothetical protein